jgi:hypothetical protein
MGARKRAGRSVGSMLWVFLDKNRNLVWFEGIGRRPFEVIEDKLIPLVLGAFREQFLIFLDA